MAVRLLALLLALSVSVNVGFCSGLVAARTRTGWARALLVGGSAAASTLAIIFGGVSAFR
ncbi:hypothetical protein ACTU45_11000 [Streptomyces sp. 24-1644]|uniref:hypothetical protein n=1 Tax=Streptomyces sp. 24-1644 TaxID=3457315 RepID=UPI003FA70859